MRSIKTTITHMNKEYGELKPHILELKQVYDF